MCILCTNHFCKYYRDLKLSRKKDYRIIIMIIIVIVNCRIYQNFITGLILLSLHTEFTHYYECTVYNVRFKNQNFWNDSFTYKYRSKIFYEYFYILLVQYVYPYQNYIILYSHYNCFKFENVCSLLVFVT